MIITWLRQVGKKNSIQNCRSLTSYGIQEKIILEMVTSMTSKSMIFSSVVYGSHPKYWRLPGKRIFPSPLTYMHALEPASWMLCWESIPPDNKLQAHPSASHMEGYSWSQQARETSVQILCMCLRAPVHRQPMPLKGKGKSMVCWLLSKLLPDKKYLQLSLISCLSLGVDVKAGQQPLWVHLIDRLANSI